MSGKKDNEMPEAEKKPSRKKWWIGGIVVLLLLSGLAVYIAYICSKPKDIFDAANLGDIEAVTRFLDEGVDVNSKSSFLGWSPLHCAAMTVSGQHEMIKYLLSRGADINIKDNIGQTPLHYAGNKETAALLLSMGADINAARTEDGFTALHGAMEMGDKALIELLIEKGSDLEARYNDETVLMRTIDPYIIRLMLKHGADANAKDSIGATALHKVVRYNSEQVMRLLIENGADVNVMTKFGETPLDYTEREELPAIAALLRKHGGKTGKELDAERKQKSDSEE